MTNSPYEIDMPSLLKLKNMEDAAAMHERPANSTRGKSDSHEDVTSCGCGGKRARREESSAQRTGTTHIHAHVEDIDEEDEHSSQFHLRGGVSEGSTSDRESDNDMSSISDDADMNTLTPEDVNFCWLPVNVPSPSLLLQDLAARFAGSLELRYSDNRAAWFLQDRQTPLILSVFERNEKELALLRQRLALLRGEEFPIEEAAGHDIPHTQSYEHGLHLRGAGSEDDGEFMGALLEKLVKEFPDDVPEALSDAELEAKIREAGFDPEELRARIGRGMGEDVAAEPQGHAEITNNLAAKPEDPVSPIPPLRHSSDGHVRGRSRARAPSPQPTTNTHHNLMPKDRLIEEIQVCFEWVPYWTSLPLAEFFHQPEPYTVEVLQEIAMFGPWESGSPQRWSWKIKPGRDGEGQRWEGKMEAEPVRYPMGPLRTCHYAGPDRDYCQSEHETVKNARDLR